MSGNKVGTEQINADQCKAKATVAQSVNSAADTILNFAGEDFDTNAMHDNSTNNSRITIKRAGNYLIEAYCSFAASATGIRSIQIYKNGGGVILNTQNAVASGSHQIVISGMLNLAVNDYLQINVYQSSGGALDVSGGTLSVVQVS